MAIESAWIRPEDRSSFKISHFAFKLTDRISRATLHLPSKELEGGPKPNIL